MLMKEVLKMKLEELIKSTLQDDYEDTVKNAPPKEVVWNAIQNRINSDIATAPASDSETV